MIKVQLHDLLFTAFHGVKEEEKILGNQYTVNCSVVFYENTGRIEDIRDTIDYAVIYDIIKSRMEIPARLLETVVMDIGNEIIHQYKDLKSVEVSVRKLHPPIESLRGSVGISWHKEF